MLVNAALVGAVEREITEALALHRALAEKSGHFHTRPEPGCPYQASGRCGGLDPLLAVHDTLIWAAKVARTRPAVACLHHTGGLCDACGTPDQLGETWAELCRVLGTRQ